MRVALLTTEFPSDPKTFDGGLSSYLHKLAHWLKQNGHEPLILIESKEDHVKVFEGLSIHPVVIRPTWWYKLLDKLSRFRSQAFLDGILRAYWFRKTLVKLHKERPIDIVQHPNFASPGLFIPDHIPSVMRISSIRPLLDAANEMDVGSWKRKQLHLLEHFGFKRAKHLFGPSKFHNRWLSDRYKKDVELHETPFVPLQLAEDPSCKDSFEKQISSAPYLIFYGRLIPVKGIRELAAALPRVLEQHKDLHVLFVGKDLKLKGQSMKDMLARSLKHQLDRVHFMEPLAQAQLFPLIAGSKFVLLPSRIENFSNACLEALSLGSCVIGTTGSSYEQMIEHGVDGLLCDPSDADALHKTILHGLKMSEVELNEMRAAAKRSSMRFDPDLLFPELLHYYRRIIEQDAS